MKKFLISIYLFIITMTVSAYDADFAVKGNVEKIDGSYITVIINSKKEVFKLAPKWYLMENGYFVKEGETVEIKYRKINNTNNITEVIRNRKVYKFTDGKGDFLWKRGGIGGKEDEKPQKTWVASDSSSNNTSGTTSSTQTGGTVVSTGGSSIGPTGGQTQTGGQGTVQIGGQIGGQPGGHNDGGQHGTYIKPFDGGMNTGGKTYNGGRDNGDMGGKGKREMSEITGMTR